MVFPHNFIKGLDLVGPQLFGLRIRNSTFDDSSCALIREIFHGVIKKAN